MQILNEVFDQIFGQIFGQGFDQGLGRGKNKNTVYSATRPKERLINNIQQTVKKLLKTLNPLNP